MSSSDLFRLRIFGLSFPLRSQTSDGASYVFPIKIKIRDANGSLKAHRMAAQKLRRRKNLFVLDNEVVTVFSEPTTATAFVSSAQFVGERAFSDWSTKPTVLAGQEITTVLPLRLAWSEGGCCGATT